MRRFPPHTIGRDVDRAFTRWTAPLAPRPVVGVDADDVLARAGLAPRLDLTTALLFLARDAYEARRTFFQGLELVPPYAVAVESRDGPPGFSVPPPEPCGLTDRAAAARALRERLDLAIEDRIAGVPRVGITASGGLDSTAVAVGASRVWRRLGRDPRDLRLYHLLPRTGPTEVAHAEALASDARSRARRPAAARGRSVRRRRGVPARRRLPPRRGRLGRMGDGRGAAA